MFSAPGQDSEMKSLPLGEQVIFERLFGAYTGPRIETNSRWFSDVGSWRVIEDSSKDGLVKHLPIIPRNELQFDRAGITIKATDSFFGLIDTEDESLAFSFQFEEMSDENEPTTTPDGAALPHTLRINPLRIHRW
jgi:hypothetical protein